jgi:hypothetical protein
MPRVVALRLGAWAGTRSRAAAGAIRVVAGLVSSVLAAVAVDRRAQQAPERITGTSSGSSEEQDERYEHRNRRGGREQVDVA